MINVKIVIPNYKGVEPVDGSRPYHVYTIQVNVFLNGTASTCRTYFLEKRYSDFLQLHNLLRRQYETPPFPPKRVRNSRVKVLETRRVELEYYLQIMTEVSPIPKEVLRFLDIAHPKEYLPVHYRWRGDARGRGSFSGDSSDASGNTDVLLNPAAAFSEDPFIDSDSSSNLSDSITRGVLDALYHS